MDRTARETLTQFAAKKLATNQLALALMDLRPADKPAWANVRGGEQV